MSSVNRIAHNQFPPFPNFFQEEIEEENVNNSLAQLPLHERNVEQLEEEGYDFGHLLMNNVRDNEDHAFEELARRLVNDLGYAQPLDLPQEELNQPAAQPLLDIAEPFFQAAQLGFPLDVPQIEYPQGLEFDILPGLIPVDQLPQAEPPHLDDNNGAFLPLDDLPVVIVDINQIQLEIPPVQPHNDPFEEVFVFEPPQLHHFLHVDPIQEEIIPAGPILTDIFENERIYESWLDLMIQANTAIFSKPHLKISKKRDVYLRDGSGIRTQFSVSPKKDVPYVEICTKKIGSQLKIDLWHGWDKLENYELKESIMLGLNEELRAVMFSTNPLDLAINDDLRRAPPSLKFSDLFQNERIYESWLDMMIRANTPIFSKPHLKISKKRDVYLRDGSGIRTQFSVSPKKDVPYVEICTKKAGSRLKIDLWHGENKVDRYSRIERIIVNLGENLGPVSFQTRPSALFINR